MPNRENTKKIARSATGWWGHGPADLKHSSFFKTKQTDTQGPLSPQHHPFKLFSSKSLAISLTFCVQVTLPMSLPPSIVKTLQDISVVIILNFSLPVLSWYLSKQIFVPSTSPKLFLSSSSLPSMLLNPLETHQSSFYLTHQQYGIFTLSSPWVIPMASKHHTVHFLLSHWMQLLHLLCCFSLIHLSSYHESAPAACPNSSLSYFHFTSLVTSPSLQL